MKVRTLGVTCFILFVVTAAVSQAIYPESFGASASASDSTNLIALQHAIYASFGCGDGLTCRTNASGLSNLNRPLVLSELYHINGELKLYHVIGFTISCSGKMASGIVQDAANQRIFDGQSVAYGEIDNCNFSTTASQTVPLIDLDFDGSQGSDLRPQNITFYDDTFGGGGSGFAGVQIAKAGGGAQGDNIRCVMCYFSNFTQAAWLIGQAHGGVPAVCDTLATNGTREQIIGGDMQSNFAYGVLACGGDVDVIGTSMENGFAFQTGYDIWCPLTVGNSWCKGEGVRSESRRLMGGGKVILKNSWLVDQASYPSPGNTCTSGIAGGVFEGSIPGGQGIWYKCSVGGTFGGLGTPGTPRTSSSGTATTEVDAAGGLTVNAWTGWRISWVGGTCINNIALITSNTATTYTFSAGIVSPFSAVSPCAAPDATSTFVIEPPYGTFSTFADGTATLATMGENGMDNTGGGATTAVIDNVFLAGEQLNLNTASNVGYLRVTRADWMSGAIPLSGINNVKIVTTDVSGTFNNLFRKPTVPAFSNLPAVWPDGGPPLYCSDCNSTCTAGSSTGRTCFRENGSWTH
jgi:hypothetical protein